MTPHFSPFINPDAWDAAGWRGVLFGHSPNRPPFMGLYFANETAGKRIFSDWIAKVGREDEYELILVSIIEGEIPGQPSGCTVYLGTHPQNYIDYLEGEQVCWRRSRASVL
jgi:hypothetical protein